MHASISVTCGSKFKFKTGKRATVRAQKAALTHTAPTFPSWKQQPVDVTIHARLEHKAEDGSENEHRRQADNTRDNDFNGWRHDCPRARHMPVARALKTGSLGAHVCGLTVTTILSPRAGRCNSQCGCFGSVGGLGLACQNISECARVNRMLVGCYQLTDTQQCDARSSRSTFEQDGPEFVVGPFEAARELLHALQPL